MISDTVKEDASQAVAAMKQQNIRTVMLTGDKAEVGEAVAGELGIDIVYADLLPADITEDPTETGKCDVCRRRNQ